MGRRKKVPDTNFAINRLKSPEVLGQTEILWFCEWKHSAGCGNHRVSMGFRNDC